MRCLHTSIYSNESTLDISETEAEKQLGKEEKESLEEQGLLPLHETSATDFLVMGLELEELQYVYYYPLLSNLTIT